MQNRQDAVFANAVVYLLADIRKAVKIGGARGGNGLGKLQVGIVGVGILNIGDFSHRRYRDLGHFGSILTSVAEKRCTESLGQGAQNRQTVEESGGLDILFQ